MGPGQPLKLIEWVVDIVPGRDGSENLKILKRQISWCSTVEVHGWVFRIWSKQISLGLNQQRWIEFLDTTRSTMSEGGGQHSMVSIGI